MRKVLLGTTALAAMGLLAGGAAQAEDEMAGPVSVSVGGYYNAAVGFVSGDQGEDRHSPSVGHSVNLTVGGSTTLDNGITVGVSANFEEGHDVFDEHHAFFNGPFGDIKVGAIESAAQQLTNFAPSAAGIFGVNSPHFIFAPGSYITTYTTQLGAEDAAKLVYFTPAVNGLRLGVSYAPSDTENGRAYGNGNAMGGGGYKDHMSVGAEYAADFGDASLRAMVGYESFEYDGMCNSNVAQTAMMPATGMYRLGDKLAKIGAGDLSEAEVFMVMNKGMENEYHKLTPKAMAVVDKAMDVWGGDGMNPLLVQSDKMDMNGDHLVRPKMSGSAVKLAKMYEFMDPSMMTGGEVQNCSPDALRYGATISSNGFSFGGGALHTDVSNQHTRIAYDLGLTYGAGAYTLGLVWGHAETEEVMGGETEQDRYAINASYVLGPGVSLQAQADTGTMDTPGMGESDWTQVMFGTSVSF